MKRLLVRLRWSPTEELAVGTLAELERGRIVFEFDEAFLATGWELSRWKLGAQRGLVEHTDRGFGPLFGVFDDSLPDGWGLLLMDRWFRGQGVDPVSVSPLDRLAYLGTRTMGALTYHPPREPDDAPSHLDLVELAGQAAQVLGSDADVLPELRRAGGSPGGARPKVVVGIRGDDVLSGVEELPAGWEHWLVKFSPDPNEADDGPLEHAYMAMASAAGLDVPRHRLFAGGRFFGARRFDRVGPSDRLHMHTLGGLLHSDYRLPACDYDQLLRVARAVTENQRAVVECFRRMVFNVVAHNRDDHVKNFAFLMDDHGHWTLSPAYDLVFARGPGGEHTMTIDGEGRTPTLAGVLKLGARHGIERSKAIPIIERVHDAVASWPALARDSGADQQRTRAIAKAHLRLR
jgi:serine/threonine-protein kinase HipA